VLVFSTVALWTNPVFWLLLGYAGVMLLISAGNQAWIQRIDKEAWSRRFRSGTKQECSARGGNPGISLGCHRSGARTRRHLGRRPDPGRRSQRLRRSCNQLADIG